MKKTHRLTLLALFVAIELALGLTPNLGFIRLNPTLTITIVHVPVILAALTLGPGAGAVTGFFFGLTSLLNATFLMPNPIESPIFSPFFQGGVFSGNGWSLVICFVPRVLVGLVVGWLFSGLSKTKIPEMISLVICGLAGSMTNTLLVLGGIYVFFGSPYAAAYEMTLDGLRAAMMAIISFNGLLEAALAAFLACVIGRALLYFMRKYYN